MNFFSNYYETIRRAVPLAAKSTLALTEKNFCLYFRWALFWSDFVESQIAPVKAISPVKDATLFGFFSQIYDV